jgi:hypothetical protein
MTNKYQYNEIRVSWPATEQFKHRDPDFLQTGRKDRLNAGSTMEVGVSGSFKART